MTPGSGVPWALVFLYLYMSRAGVKALAACAKPLGYFKIVATTTILLGFNRLTGFQFDKESTFLDFFEVIFLQVSKTMYLLQLINDNEMK